MSQVGCVQRLTGLFVILLGAILLVVFIADDFTLIGIVDNIVPIAIIGIGVKIAFPNIRLPKLGK